jgi:hypothetical protein
MISKDDIMASGQFFRKSDDPSYLVRIKIYYDICKAQDASFMAGSTGLKPAGTDMLYQHLNNSKKLV